jgi:hypothetical protein
MASNFSILIHLGRLFDDSGRRAPNRGGAPRGIVVTKNRLNVRSSVEFVTPKSSIFLDFFDFLIWVFLDFSCDFGDSRDRRAPQKGVRRAPTTRSVALTRFCKYPRFAGDRKIE